ncbi:hypothetical protein Tco_0905402 [Tanacetum coccineum]
MVLGIAPVAIIDRQLPFEYTITSRSTDVVVMAQPVQNINHSAFRSMFEREKLSGNNFNDWFRQLNEENGGVDCDEEDRLGTESRLRPYHFNYPERSLTMEEMLNKFIDEGKREHEEMRAFIYDFQTTNELLFKERNNSLIELRFGVQELLKLSYKFPDDNCDAIREYYCGEKTYDSCMTR